jgi:hypothetical protein
MLVKEILYLKKLKKIFETFKLYHGPTLIQQMDETNKKNPFCFATILQLELQ